MSFTSQLQYFRDALKETHPELKEWTDAFNVENIPATAIDKAYHLAVQPSAYVGTAHGCLGFRAQTRLRVFIKGFKTPKQAVDKALEYADSIIKSCCKSTRRVTHPLLKNVLPNNVDIQALGQTNDNIAYLDFIFDITLVLDPDSN